MPAKKKIYKLPTYLAPREKNNKHKYKYIPRKIFQTGGSCEVTKGMYDAVHTWIDKNPDWEYHFFDNNACRDFIKEHFPKKVLDAYDNLIPGAYKADLWRYCVLYIHGGLYVDNKCELLASSLNDVITQDARFLSIGSLNNVEIAFMCSERKHDFLKNVIELIIKNIEDGYYGYSATCPTGPIALGSAIKTTLGNNRDPKDLEALNIKILPFSIINYSKNIRSHHVINYEYQNYRIDLFKGSKNIEYFYRFCWLFDCIYSSGKVKKKLRIDYLQREVYLVIGYCYEIRQKKLARKITYRILKKYGFANFIIWKAIFRAIIKHEFLPVFIEKH